MLLLAAAVGRYEDSHCPDSALKKREEEEFAWPIIAM
jgi:hypothetical protein